MKLLHGVTTAMVTPFTKEGDIDFQAVEQLTNFLVSKGVQALFPLGTTGEMLRLSIEERKAVAETVVRAAAGRVTVYIHAGATTTKDTIALARHAHAVGADGIGVVTPIFSVVNDREMEQFYVEVASSVPAEFPVYLYNIPQCSANDLSVEVVQRVATQCRNVVGLKYSYPDFTRTGAYLALNDFSVVQGADHLFVPALAMGCSGTVSGVSSVFPEPFVEVYRHMQSGDLDEARRWQHIATRYCNILQNGRNMAYFKAALNWRGLTGGSVRSPQLDLAQADVELLHQSLREMERETSLGLLNPVSNS
ncbi:dihydrodipicolinate synthase family protein [Paenibacillus sp. IB182496]|uniref:Dihydrodipicolinate synthase family protein n=1 Tax=Paenibacillus sabuli TaxID=2772509 RepID=A0A927BXA3_9BACL|nr:dihydrodipicolinate synthase family protein [Paenibacillus sabuli]MBD2847430.1 dihydrodipicolinate synthase family protein [Paenibacillus sabuli]